MAADARGPASPPPAAPVAVGPTPPPPPLFSPPTSHPKEITGQTLTHATDMPPPRRSLSLVHFDVPTTTTDGREIIPVDSHGLLPAPAARSGLDDFPVIPVGVDNDDGNYFTDYLQHLHTEASCDMPPHLHTEASCDMPCEELVGQTASSEMLQEQDFSSLKNILNTATLNGSSSSSVQSDAVAQDTIEVPLPPWHCLSLLPIWVLPRFKWGYTFYIRNDLKGFFHTYPRVGGPFQSFQEATSAIDCCLENHRNTTFMDQPGISQVEKVVRKCLYWPDGTRKRRMESEPTDERRDSERQLVQALVDKYNEYNHLTGDVAYEVKDVVRFKSFQGAIDPSKVHYHINFTMKTKGADDSTHVIDDLFFAEVTFKIGHTELVVSCFCMVKPTDNGCCPGCDVKHPNDAAAYTGADAGPLGGFANLIGGMEWTGYHETLEEEETRIRRIYENQGRDDPIMWREQAEPFRPKYLFMAATSEGEDRPEVEVPLNFL